MNATRHYDAIIIGSGAGGSAAAYRLAEAGRSVLLLERGTSLVRDGSTLDVGKVVAEGAFKSREQWVDNQGARFAPEEYFNVGGKTKWYGAALLRFGPEEFHADPAFGCAGWPVSHRDLDSHYADAERLLGVREIDCEPDLARITGSLRDSGWYSRPLPMGLAPAIAGDAWEARHFDGFASVKGLKADAETALLDRVRTRSNLEILTNARVEDLLGDLSNPRRISGVRLDDGRIFRGSSVLLAAGALHSPRLLQRYLAGTGLDRELPAASQVGRNLKLHLLTAMVALSPSAKTDAIRKTRVLLHDRHPHSTVQPLGFDGDLISTLVPRFVPRALASQIGKRSYGFFLQTEDGSSPDNRVVAAAGSSDPPLLDYDRRRLPAAASEHRALVRNLRWSLARAGFLALSQSIGLQGTAHACGTLAAGSDPATSVVNAFGAVHGMQDLYVVDGSVLPRSSRVNPSLTIYAWSLRVATELAVRLEVAA
jgi:choline dehydrogenase-like flavoprotein